MRFRFYREHKYVSHKLNELERAVAKADFTSDEGYRAICEKWQELKEMLSEHANYENNYLHPLLKNKGSKLFEEVEKDHEKQEKDLKDLSMALESLKQIDDVEELAEKSYQFYLQYRRFVGENLLHLYEEETVLLPELQRLYTDRELMEADKEIFNIMTDDQMVEMLQVLFPHMNPQDQGAILNHIHEMTPEKHHRVKEKVVSIEKGVYLEDIRG